MSSRIGAALIAQLAFEEQDRRDRGHVRNAHKPKAAKTHWYRRQPGA
jgi:hypothetical protein